MWWMSLALAQSADVATGWYLWQTGQDDRAYALADELLDAEGPLQGEAVPFVVAMAVDRDDGATMEAWLREELAVDSDDPARRVALAWGISLRHTYVERGANDPPPPWCDEVRVMVSKVLEGDQRYWAALADRQRELRCEGITEHAEAQLRRIAKDGDQGQADAVLGELRAGYYKTGFQDVLEGMWSAEPHRLRDAGLAWAEGTAGPSRAAVRRVTSKALQTAVESGEPVQLHAAMLGYRGAGKDGPAEDTEAALRAADPAADPSVERSLDDVADPPIYAKIDECVANARSYSEALKCLRRIEPPDSGAVAAHYHAALRAVHDYGEEDDKAFEAAQAAWEADPRHRFYARVFADRAIERQTSAEGAVKAARSVLGEVPEGIEEASDADRAAVAKNLLRLARALLLVEQPEEAVEHLQLAARLATDPELPYWLGMALADAERADEAVLVLVYALAEPVDDLGLVGDARRRVDELLGDWHPRGTQGALEEAARRLGAAAPAHPLVGKALPDGLLELPEVEEGVENEATVLALYAGWRAPTPDALGRVHSIGERYAPRGVRTFGVDVGSTPFELPEDLPLVTLEGEAATMRALQLIALPSVIVLDAKGKIRSVLAGYSYKKIALEEALDAFVPELPEDEEEAAE